MLFVIIGLLFLAILLSGLFSGDARRERRRQRLAHAGEPVTATVTAAEPTGRKRGGLAEVRLVLPGARVRAAVDATSPGEQPLVAVVTSFR